MVEDRVCHLFRRPEGLGMGKGIGYCDIDSSSAICEGDVLFCERPEALQKYLHSNLKEMEEKEE